MASLRNRRQDSSIWDSHGWSRCSNIEWEGGDINSEGEDRI
jgi:hypothetical protein